MNRRSFLKTLAGLACVPVAVSKVLSSEEPQLVKDFKLEGWSVEYKGIFKRYANSKINEKYYGRTIINGGYHYPKEHP